MNEFAKQTRINHLKKFFGESCKIDPRFRTIKDIEYIRIGKVLILTKNVEYNKKTKQYYYLINENKKISLKTENVFFVYVKEIKTNMYALILTEKDFITSNNVHYPKNYKDAYWDIYQVAAYQNSLNYTITKPKKFRREIANG